MSRTASQKWIVLRLFGGCLCFAGLCMDVYERVLVCALAEWMDEWMALDSLSFGHAQQRFGMLSSGSSWVFGQCVGSSSKDSWQFDRQITKKCMGTARHHNHNPPKIACGDYFHLAPLSFEAVGVSRFSFLFSFSLFLVYRAYIPMMREACIYKLPVQSPVSHVQYQHQHNHNQPTTNDE